jgi:hypothetical protein
MLRGQRNREPLSQTQIDRCLISWAYIRGNADVELDVSEAGIRGSYTRYLEGENRVVLGADVYPGEGVHPNSRMSMLACLSHEFAHAERYVAGYHRPLELPDVLIDEAETSLRASFRLNLNWKDREDLVEDASENLIEWLRMHRERGD